jgi:UDP-3-O-[3-hydroxymyristoyl] N-acetylglucosamine deacetylase
LLPAEIDTGIVFKRTDIEDSDNNGYNVIPAHYRAVSNTSLCTTISNEHGVKVATIEHLMAAFWGCGVDNVIVEINGPEVPIMDGSSEPFVFMIECAHVCDQTKGRKIIEVLKSISITDGDATASISPADAFAVSMEIDFVSKAIAKQTCVFDSRSLSFKMDLCRARTFGFAEDVSKLQALGLALGGSLENAIVISGDEILNEEGLRFQDEFVRHKILDSIGDFYLAGAHIRGHFHGVKSGHAINNKLLKKFFDDKDAWRELPVV